jgi:Xaa-Pro aminopeptidase
MYAPRRQRLMQEIGQGLILLPGNEEAPMNYTDNVYPFRQDSNFLYFTGIRLPHLALLLDADKGTETLFGNEPTIDDIVWMGPQPSLHALAQDIGIANVRPFEELAGVLGEALGKGRAIHYTPTYRGDQAIRLSEWLSVPVTALQAGASEPLIHAIVRQRAIKNDAELLEIEAALATTGRMHLEVMRKARAGMSESELAGIAAGIAVSGGGQLAYGIILTINGHVLHNHEYHNTLREGQLLLGDFGAETANGYAGDITRTFPVSAAFSAQQRDIYELVLATETNAIHAVKPGVLYRDIHLGAARQIASGLKDLGIMQGDVDEAVAAGAHALFFPHGLGHMLGLDVHDMEGLGEHFVGYRPGLERSKQFGLKSLRLARELEPGFVLTVEPGIYFIPELIAIWEKEGRCKDFIRYDRLASYLGFTGIRIEDNVVVTPEGNRVLGSPIPKTIAEVEDIRREALNPG